MLGDGGLHVVVLHVHGEQAERRHVAGVLRHDDTGEVEDVDEAAGEEGETAERREHEVAHVEAALDADLAQGVRLVPRRDLEDAGGAVVRVDAEPGREGLDAAAGRVDVEGISPPSRCRGSAQDDGRR